MNPSQTMSRTVKSLETKNQESSGDQMSSLTAAGMARLDIRRPSVPLDVLKTIVDKTTWKKVTDTIEESRGFIERTPCVAWEQKTKLRRIFKQHSKSIRTGSLILQRIKTLQTVEQVNDLYLRFVRDKQVLKVEKMLSFRKVDLIPKFEINCLNEDDTSALDIAINNRDGEMMKVLLNHQVQADTAIFHAVDEEFSEGVEILLGHKNDRESVINDENDYYQIGMTPMIIAAHRNNYRILQLLGRYGHTLENIPEYAGSNERWEEGNKRRMIYFSRAQPAYIVFHCETTYRNPMDYCLQEIHQLRNLSKTEREFNHAYYNIVNKLEDFMCSLLDMICSSNELEEVFGCKSPDNNSKSFLLLESACHEGLVRFVTHHHSQLAITKTAYRDTEIIRAPSSMNALTRSIFIGLLFPVFSIISLVAPNTPLGGFLRLPRVCFLGHITSELLFALLLTMNAVWKTSDHDYLGARPSMLEFLILLWVMGKWWEEATECYKRGIQRYFQNYWNYVDLITLVLLSGAICIRVVDIAVNKNVDPPLERANWNSYEPRLIAVALQAIAYVFGFTKLMNLMAMNRQLGPLQISLIMMLGDVFRFLWIYMTLFGSFAVGFSELYGYYGTAEGCKMLSGMRNKTTEACATENILGFGTLRTSVATLFWASFGYFEPKENLNLNGSHAIVEHTGKLMAAAYHITVIIVLINMLIAMMSNSYEAIKENEETVFNFKRISRWIEYVQNEKFRPPPMNLIPNPKHILQIIKKLTRRGKQNAIENDTECPRRLAEELRNMHRNVTRRLMYRYKVKHLVKNSCSNKSEYEEILIPPSNKKTSTRF